MAPRIIKHPPTCLITCQRCGKQKEVLWGNRDKQIRCSRACANRDRLKPNPTTNAYRKRARRVMEEHLGRKLTPQEEVHHISGDIRDNRLENLKMMSHAEHQRLHAVWLQNTELSAHSSESRRQYQKEWQERNRDKCAAYSREYRKRQKASK